MGRIRVLITGLPGSGKTTIIRKASERLASFHPAGFYTDEFREGGVRAGFELVGLDGRRTLLSHVSFSSPFRVAKYGVDLRAFEEFLDALSTCSRRARRNR